jgi:hypothetical protein
VVVQPGEVLDAAWAGENTDRHWVEERTRGLGGGVSKVAGGSEPRRRHNARSPAQRRAVPHAPFILYFASTVTEEEALDPPVGRMTQVAIHHAYQAR